MPSPCAVALRTMPVLFLLLTAAMPGVRPAGAHAELESASPPVGGTVTALPPRMTLVFSEEVKPGSVVVEVTGPDGSRVDAGDAAVDLDSPGRATVTVSLFAGGPGEYSVHWETVSNADDEPATGDHTFTVAPAATVSSPVVPATPTIPTPTPTAVGEGLGNANPLASEGDFDSRAFLISIGAGLIALAVIAGFWLAVRPRNPRFGPRSGRDQR